MKNLLTILLLTVVVGAFAQPQLKKLKFDSDKYFYRRTPGNSTKSLKFAVQIKVPQSIELMTSDNGKSVKKFKTNGNGNYGKGKPLTALAIPLLFEVEQSSDGISTIFKFGKSAAEEDQNSAEVYVALKGNQADNSTISKFVRPPVDIDISQTQVLNYPENTQRTSQGFLQVDASTSKTATISIKTDSRRGQVYVCIFDNKGNLLKALNPKDPNGLAEQSFTVDESVFVIPVIASKFNRSGGNDSVVFEVGDPKEIATIEVIEE